MRGNPSNRDLYDAMMEKRRSNAARPHLDRRTKRQRTKREQIRKAVREQDED